VKILFDECMPEPLRPLLVGLDIRTAQQMGWGRVKNGELLKRAEGVFDVFVTADQSLKYQQNLTGRRLAILVLSTNRWPRVKAKTAEITAAIQPCVPEITWSCPCNFHFANKSGEHGHGGLRKLGTDLFPCGFMTGTISSEGYNP
jgi:hypothetical protein